MKYPVALILAVGLLAGCQPQSRLVGKWRGDLALSTATMHIEIEHNVDHTYDARTVIGPVTMRQKGTWRLEGDNLTTKTTWTDVQGPGVPSEQLRLTREHLAKSVGKEAHATIKFEGNDKIVESGSQNGQLTLSRVK